MSDRYARMFERVRSAGEGAFVPFTVLGDPNPQESLEIVRLLAESGADALELGLPFSDPIADGATIQAADVRALGAGTRIADALAIVAAVRDAFADLPLGLLVYANLVERHGVSAFYQQVAASGADSVLVADVPAFEMAPYAESARGAGVFPVLIATPSAPKEHLSAIAERSKGYTYVVTRRGVTGVDPNREVLANDPPRAGERDMADLIAMLKDLGAPPALLGFGISTPDHVRRALRDGAAGAICGSAVVRFVENMHRGDGAARDDLRAFVSRMKGATRTIGNDAR